MESQKSFYLQKLEYEIDSWDLNDALISGENIVIVDARSVEAYGNEHIPGAISLPHRLMDAITTNELDKESLYVTYCDGIGCNASTKGALNLTLLGFNVKELLGGLDWWKRDGYPTEGVLCENEKIISCGC